jgi:hypothetical protein
MIKACRTLVFEIKDISKTIRKETINEDHLKFLRNLLDLPGLSVNTVEDTLYIYNADHISELALGAMIERFLIKGKSSINFYTETLRLNYDYNTTPKSQPAPKEFPSSLHKGDSGQIRLDL